MDRDLVKLGAVATAVTAAVLYVVASPAEVLLSGVVGGLVVGLRSGHWNDEVVSGGAGALLGGGVLFVVYTAVLVGQVALNPSDPVITLSIAGVTYGYVYTLVGVIPLSVGGAVGGFVGRWIGRRAHLTPDST
ncbi:hypothetical protein [Halococcus salsus]|uniref:hypothetical protein n=1 Tax=Halococcus salsus TaxID=2162894 RepID=UPI0013593932|nr:hypothetical protein [Halococcus salsus]